MEITVILVLLTCICNFGLGIFVFLKNPSKWLNRLYSLFAFSMGFWVFTNLMTGLFKNLFWLKSTYALGVGTVAVAAPWILYFCEKRFDKLKFSLILIPALILFGISFYNGLIVKDVTRIYLGGFEGETGPAFPFYSAYILGSAIFLLGKLYRSYRKAKGIEKVQFGYMLMGFIVTLAIATTVSLILPLFGILKFTHLDSPSLSIFLVFTAYAIVKHHLMEVRVIATEVLVGLVWLMLLIEVLATKDLPSLFLKSGILIAFSYLGWSLTKSVLEAIRRREELEALTSKLEKTNIELKENEKKLKELTVNLEKRVQERTKELQEKVGELEKFYRVTVGRELKMVELKEEIEKLKEKTEKNTEK